MLAETVGSVDFAPVLQPVEVHVVVGEQEEVAVARVAEVERGRLRRRARGRRRTCRRGSSGPRGRGDVISIQRAAPSDAPGVGDADRDRAAGARPQPDAAPVEVEDRLARQHVEARLERVQVRVDVAVGELDEDQPGVRGAVVAADQHRRARARAVLRAAPARARCPRGGSAGARHALAFSSTAAGRCRPPHGSRRAKSAPRTYVPAGDEQLVGREARDHLGPVGVTMTSSSIRAAERPSVAAQ